MDSSWYSTAVIALCILLQILNCSGNFEKIGSLKVEPRIYNGTLAETNATRHQASIRRKKNEHTVFGIGHMCGGSLITNSVVLSAAHCFVMYNPEIKAEEFVPAQNFIIVMGNLDRYQKTENTLVYNVARIVIDIPKFKHKTHEADIALVFLRGTVPERHPVVKPIQLNRKTLPGGTMCQATGWGRVKLGGMSDVLLTVDVPIIPRDVCVRETVYDEEDILDGMMCAGYLEGGRDSCEGDSGGPLVCGKVLGGVVSWGLDCGKPKQPGVYMDVAYYVPWIEARIKEARVSQPGRASTCFRGSFPLLSLLASLVILLKNYLCHKC